MPIQGFTATIASGASTSDVIDLGYADFRKVLVDNKAKAAIRFQGSIDNSTFSGINRQDDAIRGVSHTTQTLGSALSGRWCEIDFGTRYIRVVATGTVADGGFVYFSVVSD
jgi:hypothetical protein